MFNLFRSRQKAVRYLLGGILMIVAGTMVVTLIPGIGSSTASNANDTVIAEIGGNKLTAQEVTAAASRAIQGQRLPPEMLQVYLPQLIDGIIGQRALVYEFERLGLTATEDEVYSKMASAYPSFFPNGTMDKEHKAQLEMALGQQNMTLQDAIDGATQGVLLEKIQNLEFAASVVTPKEVDEAINRKFDKAKINYVSFPPGKFRDEVKVTPEELKKFFDGHRQNLSGPVYTIPAKYSFEVLVLDQDKVAQSIAVSDAQLRAAYSTNMDNFRTPERVHARHILVMTQGKPDADKKQLLAKAQDILKQLKNGGDFAKLAEKNSDDTNNAPKGGDLGWIVRGQMVAEFEKAVFALQPGQTSDIVTTPYGYHIAQVLEHEQARVKPFEEVKGGLADELRKQSVADKMQSISDEMRAALAKSPGSAAAIAKQYGADIVNVANSERGQAIPTLGASPEIDNALAAMKVNEVSQVLTLPANRLAIAVLTGVTPGRQAELSEVEAKVKDDFLTDRSSSLAAEKAQQAFARIKAGEDMAKVAKSMKLTVSEPAAFTHADSIDGLGGAQYVEDAFTKPVGTVLGPIRVSGSGPFPLSVIYQVVDQQHVDPAKLPGERAVILQQLKQERGQRDDALFQDSILTRLVAEKKVVIHKDAIKRLMANLRQ
jgi:peptidyl-prolyl cis-trans isomerase D